MKKMYLKLVLRLCDLVYDFTASLSIIRLANFSSSFDEKWYDKYVERMYSKSRDVRRSALIKLGYIEEDGTPTKCTSCDSPNVSLVNHKYEECWGSFVPVEYECKCVDCDTKLGHYAYGRWED